MKIHRPWRMREEGLCAYACFFNLSSRSSKDLVCLQIQALG